MTPSRIPLLLFCLLGSIILSAECRSVDHIPGADDVDDDADRTIDEIIDDATPDFFTLIGPGGPMEDNEILDELDILYTPEEWFAMQRERLDSENGLSKRKATDDLSRRWPKGVVYYQFDEDFSDDFKVKVGVAIKDYHNWTCLKFKPRRKQKNYVHIWHGKGCSSALGMRGGKQKLSLGKGCGGRKTVVHELGHAIGFHHEQTRPDRDDYVTIVEENIKDGKAGQFSMKSTIDNYGIRYDYASVMHYGQGAFSKTKGEPTIITKDPEWQTKIGKSPTFSFNDLHLANTIYKCSAHCGRQKCPAGGYMDKHCKCQCKGHDPLYPIKPC